jgi:hypothetical protein
MAAEAGGRILPDQEVRSFSSGCNDAKTSDFCLVMGFNLLDELSQIWNDGNPCLILIKKP